MAQVAPGYVTGSVMSPAGTPVCGGGVVSGGTGLGDFGDHAGLRADVYVHPQAQRA